MSKKATIHGRELMHVLCAFMQYHGSAVLRRMGLLLHTAACA